MDLNQALLLREVLAESGLVERTHEFGQALRGSTRSPGGLLLVGPPQDEPWHLTAHLDDEARLNHIPELTPTLVRWRPALDAPPHLSIGLERLAEARRGESLLVVAEDDPPVPLLERVDDVRRRGARIFSLDSGQHELASLAHEALSLAPDDEPLVSFDTAQHLVSVAAGEAAQAPQQRGVRAKLARLLDLISGPEEPRVRR